MWQELSLIHSKPGETPVSGSSSTWRTCLREITFLPPGEVYGYPVGTGSYYRGTQAHRFLLEVCAGLHSPLMGETEVFGQFRAFRESQVWHPAWLSLLDALEEDVKKLRRTHLVGIGSQSYGSLVRKRVPEGEPVALVGSGRLALDILPWLEKNPVTLLVRDPSKRAEWWGKAKSVLAQEPGLNLAAGTHWLIAAPVSNDRLLTFWEASAPGAVLDFRGEDSFAAGATPSSRYFDLKTLFGELESFRSAQAAIRVQAMEEAERISQRREASVYHRPYGWEDAFA